MYEETEKSGFKGVQNPITGWRQFSMKKAFSWFLLAMKRTYFDIMDCY